ncbi:MAG: hypothetical protein RL705_1196 [Bacteroidota bacterium]|jgi:hypothetical protein
MKKRLEAELISIAHRVLKLKNKSEVDQLYKETQKLYETLTVLKFYQDNFESVKNEVEASVLEEKLAQYFEAETSQIVAQEENPAEEPAEQEAVAVVEEETEVENEQAIEEAEEFEEPALEEEPEEVVAKNEPEIDEEEPVFKPIFELTDDEEEDDIEPAETASEVKPDTKHVALEDLLGENYVDPVFVKPNEVSLFGTENLEETTEKPASLNIASSKTIEIGLNDRVAFVNNLFGESNEDFNRVISQLNTFDTLEEAKTFLNEMVIPDYDYWVGKEDYVERFMEVVEKKFA